MTKEQVEREHDVEMARTDPDAAERAGYPAVTEGWRACPRCGSTRVRWTAKPEMAPKVEAWSCYDCPWKRMRKVSP